MSEKTYLVQVRKPAEGDRILTGGTTEKEWSYALWMKGMNDQLVYPVMVGEMVEDDYGNVIYTYYKEQNDA